MCDMAPRRFDYVLAPALRVAASVGKPAWGPRARWQEATALRTVAGSGEQSTPQIVKGLVFGTSPHVPMLSGCPSASEFCDALLGMTTRGKHVGEL